MIDLSGQEEYIEDLLGHTPILGYYPGHPFGSWSGARFTQATVSYSTTLSQAESAILVYQEEESSDDVVVGDLGITNLSIAFESWSKVAKISFTPQTSNADITLAYADTGSDDGHVYVEEFTINNDKYNKADIYITDRAVTEVQGSNLVEGSRIYGILMHEIGHAIGLAHPGLSYNSDQSIMSTDDGVFTDSHYLMGHYTPMAYDIAAVQFLYGATSHNALSTTYNLVNNRQSGDATFG